MTDKPPFDLDADLRSITPQAYPREQDRIIRAMWAYNQALRHVGAQYAQSKTDHDRMLARAVVRHRSTGERSAEVAAQRGIAADDDVYLSRLSYRLAEQESTRIREALKILHAQLDDLRTQAADARAGDRWHRDDPGST